MVTRASGGKRRIRFAQFETLCRLLRPPAHHAKPWISRGRDQYAVVDEAGEVLRFAPRQSLYSLVEKGLVTPYEVDRELLFRISPLGLALVERGWFNVGGTKGRGSLELNARTLQLLGFDPMAL